MKKSRKIIVTILLMGVMLLAVGSVMFAGGQKEVAPAGAAAVAGGIRRGGTISVAVASPVMMLDPHKVKGEEA